MANVLILSASPRNNANSNPLHSGVAKAYGMFRDAAQFLRLEIVDVVHAVCGPAGEVRANPRAMEATYSLGRRLGA